MDMLTVEHALALEELMENVEGMDPIVAVWEEDEGRYAWSVADSAEKPVMVTMSDEAVSYGDEIMPYREFCLRLMAESDY